jgi:ribosomal protein S27AE
MSALLQGDNMATPTRCPRCGATSIPPLDPVGDSRDERVCPNCGASESLQFDEAIGGEPPVEPD